MATYFGEILPVYSRAIDDEEDLEDELIPDENLSTEMEIILRFGPRSVFLDTHETSKLDCQVLIFAVGPIPCAFLQKHCITSNDQPVGVISCGLDMTIRNTLSQQGLTDNSCFIYQLKKGNELAVIVLWHQSATPAQEFLLTKKLFEKLSIKDLEAFVIATSNFSKYKCLDREGLSIPFVRSLATDVQEAHPVVPVLEVPNIVTGLPANVLTHCQINAIPATLFVSYVEMMVADSINLEAFLPLLSVPRLAKLFEGFTLKDFKQVGPMTKDGGNLYL